jgi:anti-sigma regulatory factor (Ser/Thr protein kinase)
MEASSPTARSASLAIPAKPDYVVLARLALSAVCRMTPLAPEEVADLKLAITEATTYIMGGERRSAAREGEDPGSRIDFFFELGDDELLMRISGVEQPTVSAEERELGMALIKATVDGYEYSGGTMELRKTLDYSAE